MQQKLPPVISTHAPREGSDFDFVRAGRNIIISTHAPREGSDSFWYKNVWECLISTHAPREGSDLLDESRSLLIQFQPTLPARGATANISKFSKAELSNIAKLCIELQQKQLCFPFKSVFSPLNLPPSPHFSVRTSRRTSARLSFAPHNIKGSSGMYVCLQPKCSILFSYRLPR